MIKVGCIGDNTYENKRKIQETLFKLKSKYGDNIEIISGGRKYGAEVYVKKYALEFAMKYLEYNPAHTNYNLFSAMPPGFYGRPFSYTNNLQRNAIMAKYVNAVIIFASNKSNQEIEHMKKCLDNLGKTYKIIY